MRYSIKAKISQKAVTRNVICGLHIIHLYQMTKVNVWDTILSHGGGVNRVQSCIAPVCFHAFAPMLSVPREVTAP